MPQSSDASEHRRIFILGSARSGTTTLATTMKAIFGLAGDPEGHVLSMLPELSVAAKLHFETRNADAPGADHSLSRVNRDAFYRSLVSLLWNADEAHKYPIWLDKTPGIEMIDAVPAIHAFAPATRFIFMYRDGLANIASRLRKFPGVPFEVHCQQWADLMLRWRYIRSGLPEDVSMEIKLDDLAEDPRAFLGAIEAFAKLKRVQEEPGVLRELERSSSGIAQEEWPKTKLEIYRRICGPALAEYGLTSEVYDLAKASVFEVRLPPPVGQANLNIQAASGDFVSHRITNEGTEIFVHPNQGDAEPTTLIYKGLTLNNFNTFTAKVIVENPNSADVTFVMKLDQAGTKRHWTRTVPGGESRFWCENFEPLQGVYDVTLSTHVEPGKPNAMAWAYFVEPRFSFS